MAIKAQLKNLNSIERAMDLLKRVFFRIGAHLYPPLSRAISTCKFSEIAEFRKPLIREPTIAVVVPTIRPHLLPRLICSLSEQELLPTEVFICLNVQPTPGDLLRIEKSLMNSNLSSCSVDVDPGRSIGSTINNVASATDCDLVVRLDDDDLYSSKLLYEMTRAFTRNRAPVVGMGAYFVDDGTSTFTFVSHGGSEKFTHYLSGSPRLHLTNLLRRFPYPDASFGEDLDWLKQQRARLTPFYSVNHSLATIVLHAENTWRRRDTEP